MKQQELAKRKLADKSKFRRNKWVQNRVETVTSSEGQRRTHDEAAFVISCRSLGLCLLIFSSPS